MRVLITGAGGQLGGALVRSAPAWADINAIDIEDCDFTDIPMLRARLTVEAPEVIINAAAHTAVDDAESNEGLARAVNAEAVAALVEAMRATNGQLVQVSCAFVFDGTADEAYRPGSLRNPLSIYGCTKAEGEDHLRSEDLLIRTSWLYEAGGENFVRNMMRLMKEHDELHVVADEIGAPTLASGLAKTIWMLMEKGATGIFHHCDAGPVSRYQFVLAIAEEAHTLGLIKQIPAIHAVAAADSIARAQRPAFSLLDCSATRALLGDAPAPWRENLRLMLEEEAKLG